MASLPPATVPQLFEQQVARSPEAPAILWRGLETSFTGLNQQANQLARWLVRRGVRPGSVVALALPRSKDFICAAIAVQKAGAAYLPIDLDYPTERIRYMFADASPVLALTHESGAHRMPKNVVGVELAGIAPELSALDDADLGDSDRLSPADPAQAAYVIYTSGSTGRPKGVVVPHLGVANLHAAQRDRLAVAPGDRVLQFASPSFDASFWELCMALLSGATLVIAEPEQLRPGPDLVAVIAEQRITHLTLPPSVLAVLPDGALPAGVTLVVAGEVCSRRLARRWSAGRRMINAYGPTEATVCATMSDLLTGSDEPPIGRPVGRTEVHVLDAALRPVPAGERGELYIAGPGLASGYLHNPTLTSQRFIANPFGPPGSRMYRTGDLGRWRPDGQLEFLGRVDDQVKVRGHRVELGEIQPVLLAHPAVSNATVVYRAEPGDPAGQLVAYVVSADGPRCTEAELRAHLAEALPGYMIPDTFVSVERLPTTVSGRVDRSASPAPPLAASAQSPRTADEQLLCELFAEVLGTPDVGTDQDFFSLGGNSLLIARLVDRVRTTTGTELPMQQVYQQPTVAGIARLLPAADRRGLRSPVRPHVDAVASEGGPVPVTFGQEQLWFLDRWEGASRAYHYQHTIEFCGDLRIDALQWALTELVRRHEAMRTTYTTDHGEPVQVVRPPYPVELPTHDLRALAPDARMRHLRSVLTEEGSQPFDLGRLPLVRWGGYRTGEREWTVVETGHHVLHDGWSVAVMWTELAQLYRAYLTGAPPVLPPLQFQLGDHARWQRRRYRQRQPELLGYWRKALAGVQPLDLPVARRRPPKQSFAGRVRRVVLPHRLYEQVRNFSRAYRCSPFLTMFTTFLTLLHRYTGETDLCVGSWLANRSGEHAERLIGMLVNMVAVRTQVEGEQDFLALLERVRERFAQAYSYQDAPFHEVVRAVAPERDSSRNPIVQMCFSFHDSPIPELDWPEVTGRLVEQNNHSAKFDLNVVVVPQAEQRRAPTVRAGRDELVMLWEFNTDLLDAATVDRMIAHYQQLLCGALDQPDVAVGSLAIITDGEREQQDTWQGAVVPVPDPPLHDLVLRQATVTPDAVAVRWGNQRIRYAELAAEVWNLANRLRAAGARPGALVGVCMRRSPRLLVALLASLAAGAAYVPLDPGHPVHRNRLILRTARPAVVLVDGASRDALADIPGSVLVDAMSPAGSEPDAGELPTVTPAARAYVLFTSGTTGTPKGVEVTHRSVANLLHDFRQRLPATNTDVLTAVTTVAFDIAVLELFLPLIVGAQVDLVDERKALDGQRLRDRLAAAGTTIMQATPATWRMLLDAGPWPTGKRLTALCGGEACPPDLAHELARRTRAAWNVYGPTETTIWSTAYRLTSDEGAGPPPIGWPLANTTCQVLDRYGNPQPVGVPGEIHIGGSGVALGYLDEPALTSERFLVGPGGDHVFRTGDIGRWSRSGALEFLGRDDRQVKIRGFRIELEEIESVLHEHPGVREAAVVVLEDRPEVGPRLVAYLAATGDPSQVASFLRDRLPGYMVPAQVVVLAELPRTPNGKLDRAALPAVERWAPGEAAGDGADPAPATGLAPQLARIWAETLGLPTADPDTSFFASGGHSLLALRLVARIRSELGLDLGLEAIFEYTTLREVARFLAGEQVADASEPAVSGKEGR